ncbi:hypothetical protein [Argonema galeatum]|uniref:hypothetical protein n=1 Tax=Argonema galeatum TaxID=2942762 RepID=UPI002013A499|nr:hypothetical protein [Argonema galeatum]MCL1464359.1 hypothetical protein [Argonema galeatum A003/A1]
MGFDDDSESRQFIQTHLEQTVKLKSNIVRRFNESFINNNTGEEGEVDTEVRDSLLPGRTGKFAQVQSSWEVLPDGTLRKLEFLVAPQSEELKTLVQVELRPRIKVDCSTLSLCPIAA